MTFEKFVNAVDLIIIGTICCSVHDLPDYRFRDAHDEEMPPVDAAWEILTDNGFRDLAGTLYHADAPYRQEE